ncbi:MULTISPECIES: hypothetical protein [unclassified Pantoea]|uniref:hypothetical protein n=1 Tax=unclassified Pantoea TaxID=2630326 RepID=UPI0012324488|nr:MULTISPECIES: hypothetical protein [unclassified Pantoea]KAA6101882.1 hypothetical protein F3I21_09945 [Pantoea sp. B_9]KAA6115756.1 hypothetical protein F3I18_06675 [Pantoea sp. B_10]
MHSRSLIYQWLYTRWRKCLEFIAWLAISLFLYTGHVYISFISIFFISIFMIRPILPDIIKIAKNTFIIKFYNVVLWFVSYTISLKLISYQTGALEEHLKFSPAALAFPLSLILVFSIIIILCFLMLTLLQILSLSSIFITSNVKNKIIKSKFYFFAMRSFYIIPITLPVVFSIAYASGPFFKIALLADSTFVSDCGEKKKDKMYLRLDSHSCLVSTLDTDIFSSNPELIEVDSK